MENKTDCIVMTILGSTKFRAEIRQFAWEQTKKHILVLFAPFAKEEIADVEQFRQELEIQHYQKIRMADIVFVYNKNGYIGTSTKEELLYANFLGKKIQYLEPFF